ncbi:MAG TPA: sigma-54 dependent transcriptional regulator [Thiobacillaceae bacterium]|nr:sigma-54 dependent transcriptional regulator [Thiobacillaceae bacterium]HNU63986.1 sigma-54 dependent transcriptional regulator [Thiobacillaceae bacterium]
MTEKISAAKAPPRESPPFILVVEDDPTMRGLIMTVVRQSEQALEVAGAENAHEAMEFVEHNEVAVVVTDLRMPGADGQDLLTFVKSHAAGTEVVLVSGHASVEAAVAALKSGAYDFLQKPFDTDELRRVVERALDRYLLATENRRLRQRQSLYRESGELIGQSRAIEQLCRLIEAAAAHDCSVFIQGESGSGKELVARQVHMRGKRQDRPFVAINCAAIPDNLIESELFGYRKGAFTGADRDKSGLFEAANGGTLFLDEINSASLALQAKLMRVLQDGSFYPMGAVTPIRVDVQVIAATNRPIRELVEKREFREDLYYRLMIMEIEVPPLRARPEDIALLAYYFLNKHSKRLGKAISGISTGALGALMRHEWPGNVRELENIIQRMIILTESEQLDIDCLPDSLVAPREMKTSSLDYLPPRSLDEVEAYFIRKTLRETQGDRALAADILGIDKSTLWRKIKRYQIADT